METLSNNVHDEEQYLDLLENICENGVIKADRTGTGTHSLFGQTMRFNLRDNALPLLTTKQHFHKSFTRETLWFISGDTDIEYLKKHNIGIWDSWVVPSTARYREATVAELETLLANIVELEVPANTRTIRVVTEQDDDFVHAPTGGLVYKLRQDGDATDVDIYVHQPEGVVYSDIERLRLAVNTTPYNDDELELAINALARQHGCVSLQHEIMGLMDGDQPPSDVQPSNRDHSAVLLQVYQADPAKLKTLVGWFHHSAWASCVRDSYADTYSTAMDYLLAITGHKTRKLAGGSIGKGAYGSMWRDIEDTRIIPLRTKARPIADLEDEIRDRLGVQHNLPLNFKLNFDREQPFSVEGVITKPKGDGFVKEFQFSGGTVQSHPNLSQTQLHESQVKALATQLRIRLEDTEVFESEDYMSKGFRVKGRLQDGSVVISRRIDQLQNAINLLRTNPDSRRIIVVAFDNRQSDLIPLPPCHSLFQFWTRKLSLHERVQWVSKNDPDLYEDWVGDEGYATVPAENQEQMMHEWLTRYGAPERALSCLLYQR